MTPEPDDPTLTLKQLQDTFDKLLNRPRHGSEEDPHVIHPRSEGEWAICATCLQPVPLRPPAPAYMEDQK